MLGNPQTSPKISANQRQANTCFHILNVKVSTFGNIKIAYKYSLLKRFVLAKWQRFLTASDSEFTGFSVEVLGKQKKIMLELLKNKLEIYLIWI